MASTNKRDEVHGDPVLVDIEKAVLMGKGTHTLDRWLQGVGAWFHTFVSSARFHICSSIFSSTPKVPHDSLAFSPLSVDCLSLVCVNWESYRAFCSAEIMAITLNCEVEQNNELLQAR